MLAAWKHLPTVCVQDFQPILARKDLGVSEGEAKPHKRGRNTEVSTPATVHATYTITLCTDTGIDTGGNKRHIQWRRESVCGIARFCVRIVGHCHVVRRTERDRRARIVYRKLIIQFRSNSMPGLPLP